MALHLRLDLVDGFYDKLMSKHSKHIQKLFTSLWNHQLREYELDNKLSSLNGGRRAMLTSLRSLRLPTRDGRGTLATTSFSTLPGQLQCQDFFHSKFGQLQEETRLCSLFSFIWGNQKIPVGGFSKVIGTTRFVGKPILSQGQQVLYDYMWLLYVRPLHCQMSTKVAGKPCHQRHLPTSPFGRVWPAVTWGVSGAKLRRSQSVWPHSLLWGQKR